MDTYFIPVSVGLLDPKHRAKMQVNQKTSCIWVYLWLVDKMTKIDLETGLGKVLGGKPIKLEELSEFGDRKTVAAILTKLENEGYIKMTRTPHGKTIIVTKAKKFFGNKLERSGKSGISQSGISPPPKIQESGTSLPKKDENLVHLYRQYSNDNTVTDNTVAETSSADVVAIIDAFQEVNPSYKKWFANTVQRGACKRLAETHGLERVLKAIALLPKTNGQRYFPTITTPLKLEDRWADYEAAFRRAKNEEKNYVI